MEYFAFLWFLLYCSICSSTASLYRNRRDTCNNSLGLENGQIKDHQLSASSFLQYLHIAGKGTVHTEPRYGRLNGPLAWCGYGPSRNYHKDPYFQVNFDQTVNVSGVATQGLLNIYPYYVKNYLVKFSWNGTYWLNYSSPENKLWSGNTDANSIKRNMFDRVVQTKYIRIYPKDVEYRMCLRVEIYGCYARGGGEVSTLPKALSSASMPGQERSSTLTFQTSTALLKPSSTITPLYEKPTRTISLQSTMFLPEPSATVSYLTPSHSVMQNHKSPCNKALGLENRQIKDHQLSASSVLEYLNIAGKGTVHTEPKYGRLNGPLAWCGYGPSRNYHKDPYFQVDFGQTVNVSGVATQGLQNIYPYYVKSYSVTFSLNGSNWFNYSSPGNKLWWGNTDANSITKNMFDRVVQTKYIRIYPKEVEFRMCLRVEIYGCYGDETDDSEQQEYNSTAKTLSTTLGNSNLAVSSSHLPTEPAMKNSVAVSESKHMVLVLTVTACIGLLVVVAITTVLFFVLKKRNRPELHDNEVQLLTTYAVNAKVEPSCRSCNQV